MAEQLHPIDISHNPAMRKLVEKTRLANTSRPVVMDDQVVATLIPAPGTAPQRQAPGRRAPRTRNASLLRLIGLAGSVADGVDNVSVNHDTYLADAFLQTHE